MACRNLSKFCLALLNILFWVIGVGLIVLGVVMFTKYTKYGHGLLSLGTALVPAMILLVIGILTIVLGFVGCCASFREQKCAIGVYFTLLLIVFVGMITGSALSYVYGNDITASLHKIMKKSLDNYLADKRTHDEVDFIQGEFHCCGVDNYTDWLDTPWHKNHTDLPYPDTCCVEKECNYTTPTNDTSLYKLGCYDKLHKIFKRDLVVIGITGSVFLVMLLFGMIFSCALIVAKRRRAAEVPYVGIVDPPPEGMRI